MDPLVNLAKSAVESFVKEEKILEPPKDFFGARAGVFVTIEKNGQLRGCIGTYLPTKENIAEEVIANAIATATEDYRFGPITESELPRLSYTVYILSKPEQVKGLRELNPKKYGIIVRAGSRSGLLLPDLEGVDTVEEQILICCQKGGINSKNEKITVYRFTAEKHQ